MTTRKRRVTFAAALAMLAGCVQRHDQPLQQQAHEPETSRAAFAPLCKIDGCCEGHGTVGYVQPDKFIMCTDGSPSQICDCH